MEIREAIKTFLKDNFSANKYTISEHQDYITIYLFKEQSKPRFDFERLYAKYPLKRGKAKGMEKLKKVVKTNEEYGNYERAIDNYNIYLRTSGGKFIQHFSTFVNGGWQDFLDYEAEQNVLEDDYLKLLETIGLHLKFKEYLPELKQVFPTFECFKDYLSKQKQFFNSHSSVDQDPERFRAIISKLLMGELGVRTW